MFKKFYKHSLNKRKHLLPKAFINVYKITQEARFDWKRFLNFYKISEEMKVMLKIFV